MTDINKQQQLDGLRAQILADNVCSDLAEQANQLVFGAGDPDTDIVFVGEAPGKKEDLMGEPFVGAAGRFLNEMLVTIGLEREDIYITNIVKYRPPNNRDPLPVEKKAFLPYLNKQISIIAPKLIVTLGRHSMDVLLPGLKISQVHGEPQQIKLRLRSGEGIVMSEEDKHLARDHDIPSPVILPLYHPAAALYNGGMRQTLQDDFARIPLILERITS